MQMPLFQTFSSLLHIEKTNFVNNSYSENVFSLKENSTLFIEKSLMDSIVQIHGKFIASERAFKVIFSRVTISKFFPLIYNIANFLLLAPFSMNLTP